MQTDQARSRQSTPLIPLRRKASYNVCGCYAAINRASVVPVLRRFGTVSVVPALRRFDTVSAVLELRRSP